ncbi:hypothetical protein ACWEN6_13765 [Sphaerisporangium sp. NPDC004334]
MIFLLIAGLLAEVAAPVAASAGIVVLLVACVAYGHGRPVRRRPRRHR